MKFIILYSLFLILGASLASAQTSPTYQTPTPYQLLAPLPDAAPGCQGKTRETCTTTAIQYIPGIIKLTIALAGVLAVVRIIFGGFQYISTDAITGKSSAKSIIQNAVWGLILALTAWLILYTINPKLVEINLKIENRGVSTPFATGPVGTVTATPGACTSCVNLTVPSKGPGSNPDNSACTGTTACQVNSELNSRLTALSKVEHSLYITEAYPPTTNEHKEDCHYNGTCVDAKIAGSFSGGLVSGQDVKRVLDEAASGSVNLGNSIYEVPNDGRKNALVSQGAPAGRIVVTGHPEHFHLRLQ